MSSLDQGDNDTEQSYDDSRIPIYRRSILKGTAAAGLGLGTFAGVGSGQTDSTESIGIDPEAAENPIDYVNPFIGTAGGGGGETYPGATAPHGMVQLSPDNGSGYGHRVGYKYSDDSTQGFSHNHATGTGCPGYGNFLMTATTGDAILQPESAFSHETETAEPGYYTVKLEDYDVKAELTATERVGIHRYTFPENDNAHITLDASHTLTVPSYGGIANAEVEFRDDQTLVGSATTEEQVFCGSGDPYTIHFVAQFSKPFDGRGTWSGDTVNQGSKSASGANIGAYVDYDTDKDEQIIAKVALSYVSKENALLNLRKEASDLDFDDIRRNTAQKWNERLNRIEVTGGTAENKVKFYTALYHSMLGPIIFSDVNGEYIGADGSVHIASDHTNYQMFSLWDTFRTEHPLLNLIEPEVQTDAIKSLIDMYENGGWLPKWKFTNSYTNIMIADHATSVISESYLKGLRDYDTEKAYQAMKKNSTQVPGSDTNFVGREGQPEYEEYEYVPYDTPKGDRSGSMTLEYTYNDWAIAQVAKKMGENDDYETFMERAHYYKNIFDDSTKFMRPRNADGTWMKPFDPAEWKNGFAEGSSWGYTWHVLQDVAGLIDLMGETTFIDRLDEFFSEYPTLIWNVPISHYWQGNEFDHHAPYLYNYVGQPWKTQEVIQDLFEEEYGTGPIGLPGNDDVGQMSAWFVMSAIGFYPVTPASGTYVIGSPAFEEITINLPDYHYGGGEFMIEARGANYDPDRYRYIQNAHLATVDDENEDEEDDEAEEEDSEWNVHRDSWFRHEDLENGGGLRLNMGTEKNTAWGVKPESHVSPPPSMSDPNEEEDDEREEEDDEREEEDDEREEEDDEREEEDDE